jgi:hypothetical protein
LNRKTDLALVVSLIIVALLLYFLVFRDNGENTETVTEEDSITNERIRPLGKENNGTVMAYVNL